jgi:hypothetical protein
VSDWIETINGTLIPMHRVDRIERAGIGWTLSDRPVMYTTDGECFEVRRPTVDLVIPNTTGARWVEVLWDGAGDPAPVIRTYPIVGWRVDSRGRARAIRVAEHARSDEYAILLDDGRVSDGSGEYPSVEAYARAVIEYSRAEPVDAPS